MLEDWLKAQKIIIGYLFQTGSLVELQKARTFLQDEHFSGKHGEVWRLFIRYHNRHQSVLTLPILRDLGRAQKWGEDKLFEYEQLMAECEDAADGISPGDFTYYLERIGDTYKDIMFSKIMEDGSSKLQSEGYTKAKNSVLENLSTLEKTGINYDSEIDVRYGAGEFIEQVGQAKVIMAESVMFGLPSLDNTILGLRSADVCLVSAFATVGKTSFCVHTAVNVAMHQKKNVVFVTTETVIQTLIRRVFARMSKMPLFSTPVSSQHMKSGELSSNERETLLSIRKLLETGEHGHLMLVQAPPDASLAWLRGRLLQYESSFNVQLVILDELRHMKPERGRGSEWEEFNDMFKDVKAIARTHAGRGVPMLLPYQVSRKGQERMRESEGKRYELSALSSSSEAEKTSDIVMFLRADLEEDTSLSLQIVKQRDGSKGSEIQLGAEFDFQFYFEKTQGDFGLSRSV